MILTKEGQDKLLEAAKPLMKFLNEECGHPHVQVVVTNDRAELSEGIANVKCDEFVKD